MDKFDFTAPSGNAPRPVRALLSQLSSLALENEPCDNATVAAFVDQLHQHPEYSKLSQERYLKKLEDDLRSAAYYWEETWRYKKGWPAIKQALSAPNKPRADFSQLVSRAMSLEITEKLWTPNARQAWSIVDKSLNEMLGSFYHVSCTDNFPPPAISNDFLQSGFDTNKNDPPHCYYWQPFSISQEEYLLVLRSWIDEVADCQVSDLGEESWAKWLGGLTAL